MTQRISAGIRTRELGPMGTGSNMFRTGLAHSSGIVFIGTYGPPPAIVWRYDPATGQLTQVGTPGEYQLDSMAEAPNGKVYIGTAYNGLVYEMDPLTGAIRDLGSPPVDSTPWIFTMTCTRSGEIFGAKGVGIFHLDWRTGRMESCGVVPGNHRTPGPNSSSPITRTLEERPDGLLWGDTNRWIFTLDPGTRAVTPVADIAALDDACYAVMHALGPAPIADLYFHVYPRFDGRAPRHAFGVCHAETGAVELFDIAGLQGDCIPCGWWMDSDSPRWLVAHQAGDPVTTTVAVVDAQRREVVSRWAVPPGETPPNRIAGPRLWFISSARGTLYRADTRRQVLEPAAGNPAPVECRCLAASPTGLLGTDTYDCGFAFTRDLATGEATDHGRVWLDDHRCNYGPAAFAGADGRYFLANHGEAMPTLWVTDLETNRHWRAGEAAIQLVRCSDGTVWGTQGPNPPSITFDAERCWTPGWHSRPGALFRYVPGAAAVDSQPEAGPVGPLAEAPGPDALLWFGRADTASLLDTRRRCVVSEHRLPSAILAAAADLARGMVWFVLAGGRVFRARGAGAPERCIEGFGPVERGCFVLPHTGRLVGLAGDGTVTVFDPREGTVARREGPAPLAAGPAVDPTEDRWYFAHRHVTTYAL